VEVSSENRLKLSGPLTSAPPSAPPCNLKRHFGFWVQQLFSLTAAHANETRLAQPTFNSSETIP